MKKIVFIKKVDNYDELIKKHKKLPMFIKKIIYLYKNLFGKPIIKRIDKKEIMILPFQEKILNTKIEKILLKQIKRNTLNKNTKVVIEDELMKYNIEYILYKNNIEIIKGNMTRKLLVLDVLKYIGDIQKKDIKQEEITILANELTDVNELIIRNIAHICKTVKIVSKKIYNFKNLDKELYEENGIPIQFSNSYRKSLVKPKIVINLDFDEIEINEYTINNSAIIINTNNKLKIKSKMFNGIIVNNYKITFAKEIRKGFLTSGLLHGFDEIKLYESTIKEENIENILSNMKKDKLRIINCIGNNGIINKKEFKSIDKN